MWRAMKNGYFLSEIVPNDKPLFIQYLQEKEIYDLTLTIPHPYGQGQADQWVAFCDEQTKRVGSTLQWAIRDESAALVGAIGFSEFKPGEAHKAELGYWVAKPFWGKGIATDAVKTICKMGFDEMGLIRISASILAHNERSEKVLNKAGFKLEGTMKYYYYKNEMLIDGRLFANVIEPD